MIHLETSGATDIARLAGRVLFVGLPGARLCESSRLVLRDVRPGGVILFGRNVESPAQASALCAEIRDALGEPVLVGVDQEGGLVDRLRHVCEPSPSAKAIRQAGSAELAREFGSLAARALRLIGVNINFAPVLDLGGANEENGLRARTFGTTPAEVSTLAGAYLDGLQQGGVIGCGKHFPGLGGSVVDSHRRLPVVSHSWEQIMEQDLVPFLDLMFRRAGERLRTVMISHAAFPKVSAYLQEHFRRTRELPSLEELERMHALPATINGNVVMRLLRQVLKFDGLVITDDMEMGAVVQTLSVPEASLRAIEAGSDMVLICEREANFREARDLVAETIARGRLPLSHLEAANRRIDLTLAFASEPEPFDERAYAEVCRGITDLKRRLAAAESDESYAPVFGTAEDGERRSSNF